MTPTIVLRDGQPFLVTGSPGGPRIITTTLLTILNVVDFGMDAQRGGGGAAHPPPVAARRARGRAARAADVIEALRRRGHTVEPARDWSSAQALRWRPGERLVHRRERPAQRRARARARRSTESRARPQAQRAASRTASESTIEGVMAANV